MTTPRISALFSTFNRADLFDKALASLLTQSLPRELFEVIVVDDGSADNTREIAQKYQGLLDIHYVYQENSGLAAGKNHALKLARAPISVFMDDDDIADSRLLEEHLITHEANPDPSIAVLGFTDIQQDIAALPLMHFVTQVGCQLFCYPRIKHGQMLDYSYFWGGRSSCKRSFLMEHGLFDPVFRFGCEDIELGYRLAPRNLRVIYNHNAKSTMIREVSLEDFCRRVERQGNSNWVFSRKHPTPEIESWADVVDLAARWSQVEPRFEHFKKSARDLENIVLARKKHGVEIDDLLQKLLHRAYWLTIDSHRLKGSWTARSIEANAASAPTASQK